MRKLFLIVCVVSLMAGIAQAAVQVQDDGVVKGVVEKINFVGAETTRAGQTATVDMSALSGVNWSEINGAILGDSINWTDIQREQVGVTGVNWSNQSLVGGVNWTAISNNAATSNIVCWKSNGQLGKCGTSVSGVNCTACN